MRSLRLMGLPFLLMAAAVLGVFGQEVSPAERRLRELVTLVNTGNRAEARKYIEANFSASMLQHPMEAHLEFFSRMQDDSRGFEIHSVQDSKPNQVTMLLKKKLTGDWDAMFVAVEGNAPHKIAGIGFRNPKLPEGSLKKLSKKDIERELGAFMKKLADADVFSGSVLLAKGGVPVYKAAFGTANKDFDIPNRIDTKFNLGSMNKMFTGLAIAQLAEKRKLSFEDPLSKFVPDFPDAESAQKIKIKHLLTHTAGLGPYFTRRYIDMSRANLRTVDDMMRLAKQDEKLLFEPGTQWRYSNTGMLVLGKVIEAASGQSYFDFIAENITKPAGMKNTGCFELDRVNKNLAVGYDKQFGDDGITWSNNIFEHVMRGGPQGGCYSTAEDLLLFDQALRAGKLISAESFKTVASPKPELRSPNYGFGFQVDSASGIVGHSGGFPGISADLKMRLGTGWTVVVLSNYSGGANPVIRKLNALIASADTAAGR